MTTKQASKTNWQAGMIVVSSMLITLIVLGIVAAWVQEVNTHDGIYDTTIENAVMFAGLYFALPCGLLNIVLGIFARSRDLLTGKAAVIAFIIGGVGILLGLLAWTAFIMISSFVF
jgi:hypothetical protein